MLEVEDNHLNNDAVRKNRQRRKSGVAARYTPEMQFKNFIKEAKKADFNIFENEIDTTELDFDHIMRPDLEAVFQPPDEEAPKWPVIEPVEGECFATLEYLDAAAVKAIDPNKIVDSSKVQAINLPEIWRGDRRAITAPPSTGEGAPSWSPFINPY